MSAPEGYFSVSHGSTVLNVPRRIFKGKTAEVDEKEAEKFRELTRARYPWMSDNSFDVMLRKARGEYIRLTDEETGGISTSRRLAAEGDKKGAIARLRKHLEEDPEDSDAWMELGHLLCDVGETAEGYKAFNEARKHYRVLFYHL